MLLRDLEGYEKHDRVTSSIFQRRTLRVDQLFCCDVRRDTDDRLDDASQ